MGSGAYALERLGHGRIDLVGQQREATIGPKDKSDPWLRASPERLEFKFIPDPNTMTNALRDELIDVAVGYPVELSFAIYAMTLIY